MMKRIFTIILLTLSITCFSQIKDTISYFGSEMFLRLSPDFKKIVGSNEQGLVYIWDVKTGKRIHTENKFLKVQERHYGSPFEFTEDSRYLFHEGKKFCYDFEKNDTIEITGSIPDYYTGYHNNKYIHGVCGRGSENLLIRTLSFDGKNKWETVLTAEKPFISAEIEILSNGNVLLYDDFKDKHDKIYIYKIGLKEPYIIHKFKNYKKSEFGKFKLSNNKQYLALGKNEIYDITKNPIQQVTVDYEEHFKYKYYKSPIKINHFYVPIKNGSYTISECARKIYLKNTTDNSRVVLEGHLEEDLKNLRKYINREKFIYLSKRLDRADKWVKLHLVDVEIEKSKKLILEGKLDEGYAKIKTIISNQENTSKPINYKQLKEYEWLRTDMKKWSELIAIPSIKKSYNQTFDHILYFVVANEHALQYNSNLAYEYLLKAKDQFLFPKDSVLVYLKPILEDERIKAFVNDDSNYSEFDKAMFEEDYETSKRLRPKSPLPYYYKAETDYQNEKFAEATEELKKGLNVTEESDKYIMNLIINCQYQLKNSDEELKWENKYLEKYPDNMNIVAMRAYNYLERKDYENALPDLKKYANFSQDYYSLMDLAEVYFSQETYYSSSQTVDKVIHSKTFDFSDLSKDDRLRAYYLKVNSTVHFDSKKVLKERCQIWEKICYLDPSEKNQHGYGVALVECGTKYDLPYKWRSRACTAFTKASKSGNSVSEQYRKATCYGK